MGIDTAGLELIGADRSRLNGNVLVKKRIQIEGSTLCYFCKRQPVHAENVSTLLYRISTFKRIK